MTLGREPDRVDAEVGMTPADAFITISCAINLFTSSILGAVALGPL